MDKSKKLGDAELEIMNVLWRESGLVTSGHILDRLERKWALSTLMTALSRLAVKGFVSCDRSTRTNLYTALIREEDYKSAESRSFLERMFGGSARKLVASLYDSQSLTDEDISDLHQLIEELEAKHKEE